MKYVRWTAVQELIRLINARDSFHDWSDSYQQYDKKVKNSIEWLERNAKEVKENERTK